MGVALLCAGAAFAGDARPFPAGIEPLAVVSDPGPAWFAPDQEGISSFDFYIEGGGDVRVYFDYADANDFHFFDRIGGVGKIGVRQAGMETILSQSAGITAPLRIARHG